MIRKIKPNIFQPGNIVVFNDAARPDHMCAGMRLKVVREICGRYFTAKVVTASHNHQFKVGYSGISWTKEYYIAG